MSYPKAPARTIYHHYPQAQIADEYHWLRDYDSNPEVKQWIEAENQYFLQHFPSEPLAEQLFQELKGRHIEADCGVPEKIGPYLYYSRTEPGKDYELHCRRRDEPGAEEEIYFDENEFATEAFFQLGALQIDSQHQQLLYAIDCKGDENFSVFHLDLQTRQRQEILLGPCSGDLEWSLDSRSFYFVGLDDSGRPYRVGHFDLASRSYSWIYEESSTEYFVSLSASRDESYLFVESHGHTSSEIHYLDLRKRDATLCCFAARQMGVEYRIEHRAAMFYFLSNFEHENFHLYRRPVAGGESERIFSGNPYRYLSEFELFADFAVVYSKEQAQQKLHILGFQGEEIIWQRELPMPEDCYRIEAAENSNFVTPYYHFIYSSMTSQAHYYRYHIATEEWEVKKQYEVGGDYQQENYRCQRLHLRVRDGAKVPVSLVHHRDFPLEKAKALYLYVYGAYGVSLDCGFSRDLLSLLDRGIAYAIVHVRGGSDLGRSWYEQGKLQHKKNSFTDLIDTSQALLALYPNLHNQLILSGGSAGGLTVAASLNLAPELFRLAILQVPFVDVLHSMHDSSQALTALEYEEWGDPREASIYEYIASYCPYQNLREGITYPSCLAIASLHDLRVGYWESFKWIQRLRARCRNPEQQFLWIHQQAGHSGPSGRYEYLRELAMEYQFILQQLGLEP